MGLTETVRSEVRADFSVCDGLMSFDDAPYVVARDFEWYGHGSVARIRSFRYGAARRFCLSIV